MGLEEDMLLIWSGFEGAFSPDSLRGVSCNKEIY
jgi:hypothetical protein